MKLAGMDYMKVPMPDLYINLIQKFNLDSCRRGRNWIYSGSYTPK